MKRNPNRKSMAELFQMSYDKYKTLIETEFSDTYEFVDFIYKKAKNGRNEGVIRVRHKECGEVFDRRAVAWKITSNCYHCSIRRQVSYLHAVFVTTARKVFPESKAEYDAGFKGPKGCPSKYDLMIPSFRGKDTLFEFQSRLHDGKELHDMRKKQHALENGYGFIAIDSRDITPRQAVKKYLGVPIETEVVQRRMVEFEPCFDFDAVQKGLDEGKSCAQISRDLGISVHKIYGRLYDGTLIDNPKRYEAAYGKRGVVQLTLDGKFVKQYDSQHAVYKETGWKVDGCLSGRCKHSHGFLFVSIDNYKSGNFVIPDKIRDYENVRKGISKTLQRTT